MRAETIAVILVLLSSAWPPPPFGNQMESHTHTAVGTDIQAISTQLKLYESMNGFFPSSAQGLRALVEQPASSPCPSRWFQLFKSVPRDHWHNEYIYRCPGTIRLDGYDLFSRGPDGLPDTVDDDWGW